MSERTGGCLCGQVRFRLNAEPVNSRVCWCRDCQRIAGNGTVNALFPAESIEITGAPSEYLRAGGSGHPVRRRFCSKCGCHLFADTPAYPGVVVVRVGTLDEPSSIRPLANIWSSSAPTWACLDPLLERFERQALPSRPSPSAAVDGPEAKVRSIRPEAEVGTLQRLPYFIGISRQTVDASGLSMHLVVIPPGARSEPHIHVGHETGIYVLEGQVLTRWGPALEHEVVSRAGEFLFVPPGVPHEAVNLSASEPARAVVARNDPAEQDKVEPFVRDPGAG